MPERAYVLVETVMGKSLENLAVLRHSEWVESVERTAGAYDLMVIARGNTLVELEQAVHTGIRLMDGIVRTVLCPIQSSATHSISDAGA